MSPKKSKKSHLPFLFLVVVVVMLVVAGAGWLVTQPLGLARPTVDFDISRGESMKQVARTVASAGVDVNPLVLTWVARLSGHSGRIKAGSYRIDKPLSAWELVSLLSAGANNYADFSLIEGWTFVRIRQALNSAPGVTHDSQSLTDAQIMDRLGMSGKSPEGMFAPDTYSFLRGASDLELLRRAAEHMQTILDETWAGRAPDLPLKTPYEALILASVVEKETGRAADRPLIASVFINRIRRGMPLQSDPTVIYGMGLKFTGNLRKVDLQTDTPFNSYTRGGLPPTPIATPGAAALKAVLHPAVGDYLYFVARGDGSSEFSRTLQEHNRAVVRYQRVSRK